MLVPRCRQEDKGYYISSDHDKPQEKSVNFKYRVIMLDDGCEYVTDGVNSFRVKAMYTLQDFIIS
jgi:hypothetical protein